MQNITYTMYKFRRAVCGLWRTDGFTADEICHYRGHRRRRECALGAFDVTFEKQRGEKSKKTKPQEKTSN